MEAIELLKNVAKKLDIKLVLLTGVEVVNDGILKCTLIDTNYLTEKEKIIVKTKSKVW